MFDPMSPADLARVSQLEAVFTRIGDERMKEIGLYNHALKVEAVGFRRWENWLAGILVTPWFMNFIMLPTADGQITGEVGTKTHFDMPRGDIIFTIGEVEEVGLYLSSSLYSPMDRFDVQAVAVTTAWAAVDKYFKVPEAEEPTPCNERL
ncbi:MAG TPA: [NiFe]-hydrogenase assembly chaperone HybE [Magnetospirillum sp.]|nr:[NiFe]-hydrogenase assembly chaperone HybE [Magnetospirillum sp.]